MAYQNVKDQVRSGLEPLEMERSDKLKDKDRNASEEPDDRVLKKKIDEISGRIDSILKTIENQLTTRKTNGTDSGNDLSIYSPSRRHNGIDKK